MTRFDLFAATLASAALALGAHAQSGGGAAPAQPPAPASGAAPPQGAPGEGAPIQMPAFPKVDMNAASFSEAEKSAEAAAAGAAALEKVSAAYKSAPGLTDTVTLTMKTPMGDQTDSMSVTFGAGSDAKLTMGDTEIISAGGNLIFSTGAFGDKYVSVPLSGSVSATMAQKLEGVDLPVPHLALREGVQGPALVKAFGFGPFAFSKVAGFRTREGASEVLLVGDEGADALVVIDSASGLLRSNNIVVTPPGAPEGLRIGVNVGMVPKVVDPAPVVSFDPKGKTAVASLSEAMPDMGAAPESNVIKVGSAAPDFTLKDQDGKETSLASLKGSVVVLDFWATWCGPCRKGLPKLNDFAKSSTGPDSKVKVFGMNVWERGPADEVGSKVKEYWTKEGFVFPTLMGNEDIAKAYGVDGIPLTVVIGPDGSVAAVHQGYDPDMEAKLKADVAKALAGGGKG